MRLSLLAIATFPFIVAACSPASDAKGQAQKSDIAVAEILTPDGSRLGSAKLSKWGGEISITVSIAGLEPGERAFHLHTTGSCNAPDFASAGGHLNPGGRAHGSLNPDGKHLGDLPNITTGEDGQSNLTFTFSGDPDEFIQQIFDADGTAVMIHAGPDDYASDPAGSAGPRIACGVLKRTL